MLPRASSQSSYCGGENPYHSAIALVSPFALVGRGEVRRLLERPSVCPYTPTDAHGCTLGGVG